MINPKKTLIVRNTNASTLASSAEISDWYASARACIDTSSSDYFWIGFDFGPINKIQALRIAASYNCSDGIILNPSVNRYLQIGTSSANVTIWDGVSPLVCTSHSSKITTSQVDVDIINAIAHVILTHKIELVLVTPGVPKDLLGPFYNQQVTGTTVGQYYGQATEIGLSMCVPWSQLLWQSRSIFTVRKPYGIGGGLLETDGSTSGIKRIRPDRPLTHVSDILNEHIPYCGRIGSVDQDNQHSTLAQVQDMVNNAKACELVNNLPKLHVSGGSSYIWAGGVNETVAVNHLLHDLGATLSYLTNGWHGVGYAEDALWARNPFFWGSADVEQYSVDAGGPGLRHVGGAEVNMFCFCSPGQFMYTNNALLATTKFLPGAWAFSWGSPTYFTATFCLSHGGSLGVLSTGEPFSLNVCDSSSLAFNLAVMGYCGAEAVGRAVQCNKYIGTPVRDLSYGQAYIGPAAYMTAWGDPLYAPYKHTFTPYAQIGV
jgi:hypothetical protein